MKIISMYLPQFHRVKENDEWWGEGFTDWVAVQKAEMFCDSQYQPRIPLDENYYDLLDKETMQWQADLMKQYGVDAQCIYHYWFKDGRQILEKPAENLLDWKEIDMPFCFCWANDTWARTWSKIKDKNVWASTFEQRDEANDNGILLEQQYGSEAQWKEHFDYLLLFFKDKRYIKINNCPVFVISRVDLIHCLIDMTDMWRHWAREAGFGGIYFIGANSNSYTEPVLDAVLYHEPAHVMRNFINREAGGNDVLAVDYDEAWDELLKYQSIKQKVIYGGFVDYDDTPRRGRAGSFFKKVTPEKFKTYLTELLAKNAAQGNEMVFINAWNEWGEGMYLEPDKLNRNGFLDAISYAKVHYTEYLKKYETNQDSINVSLKKEVELLSAKVVKNESYWNLLDSWLWLWEKNIYLEKFFLDRGIDTIAIYGMGVLGKHLLQELQHSKIQVEYAIDRKSGISVKGITMYLPDDALPEVDKIVVTVPHAYNEIASQLRKRGYQNVISLEEIILGLV